MGLHPPINGTEEYLAAVLGEMQGLRADLAAIAQKLAPPPVEQPTPAAPVVDVELREPAPAPAPVEQSTPPKKGGKK